MRLKDSITERTTAATNIILSVLLLGISFYLAGISDNPTLKSRLWPIAYALQGIGTLLATIAHGLELTPTTYDAIWRAIYLFLGLAFAFFATCFVMDQWGQDVALSALPWIISVSVVFIIIGSILPGLPFWPMAILCGLVLLFGLPSYSYLVLQGSLPGAGWILMGQIMLLISVVIQSTRAISFTLIWPFDHNSVFHFGAGVAFFMMQLGVRSSLLENV